MTNMYKQEQEAFENGVKSYIERNEDPDNILALTLLFAGVFSGNIPLIRYAVTAGADPNSNITHTIAYILDSYHYAKLEDMIDTSLYKNEPDSVTDIENRML